MMRAGAAAPTEPSLTKVRPHRRAHIRSRGENSIITRPALFVNRKCAQRLNQSDPKIRAKQRK